MKKTTLLLLPLISLLAACTPEARTYPVPEGYPFIEDKPRHFSVSANGKSMSLYNDTTHWGGTIDFGSFEIREGDKSTVSVVLDEDISSLELLPAPKDCEVRQTGKRTVEITSRKADWTQTLVVNGNPREGHVLHLFCNKFAEGPQPEGYSYDDSTKTHSFGAGYYELASLLGDKTLTIKGDQKIYLAPGAVVNGTLLIMEGDGAKIYGNGMVCNNYGSMVRVVSSRNCSVEDITVHGHRLHAWQVIVDNCSDVLLRGMKIFNPHYASVDGIDVVNSSHITVDSCFIRANDDAIAIKGLGSQKPADGPVMTDLTFTNLQLWNDCNNAFGIGAETHCREFGNIRFADSDILFSYDDPEHHNKLNERAALNICSLHGTYFHDITFENITVYHCQRLIGLGFRPDFWFGQLPGDQTGEGEIRNVTFRNVTSLETETGQLSNKILLYDWHKEGTPDKLLRNLRFENVMIGGERLSSADSPHFDLEPAPGHDLKAEFSFK